MQRERATKHVHLCVQGKATKETGVLGEYTELSRGRKFLPQRHHGGKFRGLIFCVVVSFLPLGLPMS